MNLPAGQASLRPYLFKLPRLSMEKPSIPKGTRDFGPAQMAKRQFILENIKKVFQKYGFQPLETPAMENLTTLTGKYGEEGDQLLFKVLENGDFTKKAREGILPAQLRKLSQDLFETVNKNLGPQKKRDTETLNKIILESLEEIHSDDKLLLRTFGVLVKGNIEDLGSKINEWFKSESKDETEIFDYLLGFYKKRNLLISDVIDVFLNSKSLLPHISEKVSATTLRFPSPAMW